jgi:hypothetical protein
LPRCFRAWEKLKRKGKSKSYKAKIKNVSAGEVSRWSLVTRRSKIKMQNAEKKKTGRIFLVFPIHF